MAQKVRDCLEEAKYGGGRNKSDTLLHIEDGGGHDLIGGDRRLKVASMEVSFIVGND